jgi:hypothetical protein
VLTSGDIPRKISYGEKPGLVFGAEVAARFFQRPFPRPDRLQRVVIKHGRAQGGALPSTSTA